MTNDQIEQFLGKNDIEKPVQINFKTRGSIKGLFIRLPDYAELKQKNLWRIVGETRLEEYVKSRDTNLARIFSGIEITKLGVL